MIKLKKYYYGLICFTAYSCAQMGYPTGGEKDTVPPKVLSCSPANPSVNFNQNEIIIRFDEYIKLNNTQQIITSPAIVPAPQYTVKGKNLYIHIKATLQPNTTYSINFGTAISDITENNINPNIIYAFSTGNTLDTLKLSGRLLNAFTQQPEKGVKIMLYPTDSSMLNSIPSYLAITDNNGFFKINFVKNGYYHIAALKDNNNNYIYDMSGEEIAIYNDTIILHNDSTPHVNLFLFKEDLEKQYLNKVTFFEPGKIIVKANKKFNSPVATVNTGLPGSIADYEFFQYSNDTLILWFNKQKADTLQLIVKDSSLNEYKTIYLDRTAKTNRNKLSITHNASDFFRVENNLILQTDYPCTNKTSDLQKILLFEDTLKINYTVENINAIKWKIHFAKSENKTYKLIIPQNTFTDIYGKTNDSLIIEIKTPKNEYYGLLNLSVQSEIENTLLLQLLDAKKNIVSSMTFNKSIKTVFNKLDPGTYNLRLIVDTDQNGEWTNGNFEKKLMPEKIIYYNSPINIRSNWDLDIIWNIKE